MHRQIKYLNNELIENAQTNKITLCKMLDMQYTVRYTVLRKFQYYFTLIVLVTLDFP